MTEPASTGIGAVLGWKALGGAAGVAAGGAGLALVVVTCMTPPRSAREWTVGLITTVMGSICGGAYVVQKYELQAWAHSWIGLVALFGVVFMCGLPAWAGVRLLFNWIIKSRDRTLPEVVSEARGMLP